MAMAAVKSPRAKTDLPAAPCQRPLPSPPCRLAPPASTHAQAASFAPSRRAHGCADRRDRLLPDRRVRRTLLRDRSLPMLLAAPYRRHASASVELETKTTSWLPPSRFLFESRWRPTAPSTREPRTRRRSARSVQDVQAFSQPPSSGLPAGRVAGAESRHHARMHREGRTERVWRARSSPAGRGGGRWQRAPGSAWAIIWWVAVFRTLGWYEFISNGHGL